MRHLLVSYHTCPWEEPGTGLSGGMNVFLRGLLPGLAGRGIGTDVFTRGKGGRTEVTSPHPGVRVFHLPCGWEEPPTRESAFRALPRFIGMAREAFGKRADPPDALSAHYWMSGIAALEAEVPAGPGGLLFSYHTVEARRGRSPERKANALSAARIAAEERIAREAARIVFLSEHDFGETGKALPPAAGKGVVIPPGVDDAFRRPPPREEGREAFGIPPDAFLFLFAARPDPGKNAPAAVDAFQALRKGGERKALLLIAGQDPPEGGAPRGVIFAGAVPHSRMPALLAAADAAVCPSEYESFGLVPLEAMAAGVPVIVPPGGHWGETVRTEGGGRVYPPGSARGLAVAMEEMMRDGSARARMSEEGKRVAARFTWERCTESWARLLSSAARRGSRR